jgi:hypothetical protein
LATIQQIAAIPSLKPILDMAYLYLIPLADTYLFHF